MHVIRIFKLLNHESMKNSYQFGFEKLIVWQKAIAFTKFVYRISSDLPREEKYGLVSQIKRSASSVAANLAEGTARKTQKDKANYTTNAFSSLMETVNHAIICKELEYLKSNDYNVLREKAIEFSRMLIALRNAQLGR